MPDNLARGDGQVPPASQSPDGNGQVPPASHGSPNGGDSDDSPSSGGDLSPTQYRELVDKLRKENAKHRVDGKELAELRAYKQQRDDASLSEQERTSKQLAEYQTRIADLETARQQVAIRAEVKLVARDLGLDQKLALRLLEMSALEFNDDGDPTNVAALLSQAVEEYGLGAVAPGALNGSSTTQPANASNGKTAAAATQQTRPQPTSVGATPANPARGGNGVAVGGWSWDVISSLTKEQYETLTPQQRGAMSDFIRRTPRR